MSRHVISGLLLCWVALPIAFDWLFDWLWDRTFRRRSATPTPKDTP